MNNSILFNTQRGLFSDCSNYYDKKKGKMVYSNAVDIINCCVNKNKKSNEYCFKVCEKIKDLNLKLNCNQKCKEKNKLSWDICRLFSDNIGLDDYYTKCALDFGCLKFGKFLDEKCVDKYKKDILKCCRKKCRPTNLPPYNDCGNLCKFLEEKNEEEILDIKNNFEMVKNFKPTSKVENKDNIKRYFFMFLFGLIFVFILLKLIFKKNFKDRLKYADRIQNNPKGYLSSAQIFG